jgi:GT2 family glycosyltransferase
MSRCADYALFAPSQLRRSEYRDLGAAALAVRKEAFVLSGGFNPEWRASEDWDFCLRLRARGWRCFFDPSAEVRHDHGRKTFTAIIRSAYCSGFASGLNVQRRHYDRLSWLAKLSVRMSSPPAYALLLLPYAFAVAALQGVESVRDDPQSLVFVPFMCAGRIAFHFGVWRRLVADRHRPPTTA